MQLSQPDTWQQQWRQKQRQFGLKFSLQSDSAISQIFFYIFVLFFTFDNKPSERQPHLGYPRRNKQVRKSPNPQAHTHRRLMYMCMCVCVCICNNYTNFFFPTALFQFSLLPTSVKKAHNLCMGDAHIHKHTHIYVCVRTHVCCAYVSVDRLKNNQLHSICNKGHTHRITE